MQLGSRQVECLEALDRSPWTPEDPAIVPHGQTMPVLDSLERRGLVKRRSLEPIAKRLYPVVVYELTTHGRRMLTGRRRWEKN